MSPGTAYTSRISSQAQPAVFSAPERNLACATTSVEDNAAIIRLRSRNLRASGMVPAYPYRSIHNPEKGGSQLACFSKFPILSARPIQYESTYNGSMQYTLKVNEDTITLINNHLESNKLTKEDKVIYEDMIKDPDAKKVKTGLRQLIKKLAEASAIRSSQADSVASIIANSQYPTIIACGDFNDASISYTHRILTQQLDDAFTQSGRGLGISYNLNKFYFRIDNILISPNLKAYNCTVDRSIKDSDHYPIWCYIGKQ